VACSDAFKSNAAGDGAGLAECGFDVEDLHRYGNNLAGSWGSGYPG
jgi:hypothetical protein